MRAPGLMSLPVVAAVFCALAAAGCGSKGGETAKIAPDRGATLIVTRDFGADELLPESVWPVGGGQSAMRQLQSASKVESSFGGRYVTAIEGVKQDQSKGYDWLFYLDGVESDVGAAAVKPTAGQVVQWDYHRWRDVKTGGAIVGAFPRPLKDDGVALVCVPQVSGACATVKQRLRQAGVQLNTNGVPVTVGTWNELARRDLDIDLSSDPAGNGAFAAFTGDRELQLAADDGSVARTLGRESGLIAAFAKGKAVEWLITGVDTLGVERAAAALDPKLLKNRFAIAVDRSGMVALPVAGGDG